MACTRASMRLTYTWLPISLLHQVAMHALPSRLCVSASERPAGALARRSCTTRLPDIGLQLAFLATATPITARFVLEFRTYG